jgi:2'-5' RNA ligase
MRLFFALWPPPATARALADWAKEVARVAGGKPVAAEKIHLTLAFLGDADPGKAIAAAQRVRARAFDLPIEVSQYWNHNQIVWTGPAQIPGQLARLVEALQLELFRVEFILERRPFAAHVTLLRKARMPPTLPDLPPVQWPANEFVLVQSRASSEGPNYASLKSFRLPRS